MICLIIFEYTDWNFLDLELYIYNQIHLHDILMRYEWLSLNMCESNLHITHDGVSIQQYVKLYNLLCSRLSFILLSLNSYTRIGLYLFSYILYRFGPFVSCRCLLFCK